MPCDGFPCKNLALYHRNDSGISLSSYEESANMSRCIVNSREPPVKRNDTLSRPQVHEILVKVFAEIRFRPYNVLGAIP